MLVKEPNFGSGAVFSTEPSTLKREICFAAWGVAYGQPGKAARRVKSAKKFRDFCDAFGVGHAQDGDPLVDSLG